METLLLFVFNRFVKSSRTLSTPVSRKGTAGMRQGAIPNTRAPTGPSSFDSRQPWRSFFTVRGGGAKQVWYIRGCLPGRLSRAREGGGAESRHFLHGSDQCNAIINLPPPPVTAFFRITTAPPVGEVRSHNLQQRRNRKEQW